MSLEYPGASQGGSELQIIFDCPAQPRPAKRQKVLHWSVPQTEEQWQSARAACGLDTPESIISKMTQLKNWGMGQVAELQPWQKMVVIAATLVDLSTGKEGDATLTLNRVYGRAHGYETRRKDISAVLRLIELLDELYSCLEHRAFELLIILNIPLSSLRLWTRKNFQQIKSQCPQTMKPEKEIQASTPFYIPFLVSLLRPNYTLNHIYTALNTNTLGRGDFERFHEVYRNRKLRPCLLVTRGDHRTPFCQLAPPKPQQQPSEPQSSSIQDDFDLGEIFHVEQMYTVTVYTSITGYKTFNLSEELQKMASRAEKEQTISTTITTFGTRIVQFDWSRSIHTPIADQAVDELTEKLPSAGLWQAQGSTVQSADHHTDSLDENPVVRVAEQLRL
ncbi:hypothetical protein CDV36_014896 [Fusarium kuroshium]|uniref:Uncharacterized protein n=1 Tax=Fusarium kuroshium TaxID=2010991 RepID=A0A3M2REH0_9HYPO|nr:hypothetical protein CDV36_014896 [Fusarium kuroshium]